MTPENDDNLILIRSLCILIIVFFIVCIIVSMAFVTFRIRTNIKRKQEAQKQIEKERKERDLKERLERDLKKREERELKRRERYDKKFKQMMKQEEERIKLEFDELYGAKERQEQQEQQEQLAANARALQEIDRRLAAERLEQQEFERLAPLREREAYERINADARERAALREQQEYNRYAAAWDRRERQEDYRNRPGSAESGFVSDESDDWR